jgi:hypothetical protein
VAGPPGKLLRPAGERGRAMLEARAASERKASAAAAKVQKRVEAKPVLVTVGEARVTVLYLPAGATIREAEREALEYATHFACEGGSAWAWADAEGWESPPLAGRHGTLRVLPHSERIPRWVMDAAQAKGSPPRVLVSWTLKFRQDAQRAAKGKLYDLGPVTEFDDTPEAEARGRALVAEHGSVNYDVPPTSPRFWVRGWLHEELVRKLRLAPEVAVRVEMDDVHARAAAANVPTTIPRHWLTRRGEPAVIRAELEAAGRFDPMFDAGRELVREVKQTQPYHPHDAMLPVHALRREESEAACIKAAREGFMSLGAIVPREAPLAPAPEAKGPARKTTQTEKAKEGNKS